MWVFDSQTYRFLAVNEAAIRQYGYSQEEFLQMTIKDIRPREDVSALLKMMETPYQDRTQRAVVRHLTKDRRTRDVEVYAQQITWDGRPAEFVQVHDITERKRAEETLRHLSTHLLQSQDEYQRRMARELHDAVGQSLTAMLANLAVISNAAAVLGHNARKALDECIMVAEQTVREVRTLSYLLHPPLLDEQGLAAALELYVEGFSQRSGLNINLSIANDLGRLDQGAETAVFRIVQEGLTNIHKHAASAKADVTVFRQPEGIVLQIRDYGLGMAPGVLQRIHRGAGTGVGITSMRERLAQLGGRLEVESSEQGTVIRGTLPVNRSEA